jgi:hypothetical protein
MFSKLLEKMGNVTSSQPKNKTGKKVVAQVRFGCFRQSTRISQLVMQSHSRLSRSFAAVENRDRTKDKCFITYRTWVRRNPGAGVSMHIP